MYECIEKSLNRKIQISEILNTCFINDDNINWIFKVSNIEDNELYHYDDDILIDYDENTMINIYKCLELPQIVILMYIISVHMYYLANTYDIIKNERGLFTSKCFSSECFASRKDRRKFGFTCDKQGIYGNNKYYSGCQYLSNINFENMRLMCKNCKEYRKWLYMSFLTEIVINIKSKVLLLDTFKESKEYKKEHFYIPSTFDHIENIAGDLNDSLRYQLFYFSKRYPTLASMFRVGDHVNDRYKNTCTLYKYLDKPDLTDYFYDKEDLDNIFDVGITPYQKIVEYMHDGNPDITLNIISSHDIGVLTSNVFEDPQTVVYKHRYYIEYKIDEFKYEYYEYNTGSNKYSRKLCMTRKSQTNYILHNMNKEWSRRI